MSASFAIAFALTLKAEGGYRFSDVTGDKGGETYAGISRRFHPTWKGWPFVDRRDFSDTLEKLVYQFYREEFWDRLRGDEIQSQSVANEVYDEAVNAGLSVAVRAVQKVVGTTQDGIIGPKTLRALNAMPVDHFMPRFKLARVARRKIICANDSTQLKFMVGWLNRILGEGIA